MAYPLGTNATPLESLPLPAPAEQTQRAEAGGEKWEGAWERNGGDASTI
jgi:hypothetical protein